MPTYTVSASLSLLYLKLVERIALLTDIKLVTKDIGQLETREQPAIDDIATALIGFENFKPSDMGQLSQEVVGDVVVKLAVPAYSIVSNITPLDASEKALKYLELGQEIYTQLHGWSPQEPFGSLTRTGFSEDLRRPGLMVYVQRFRISYDDHTAKRTTEKVAATLSVNPIYLKA